MRNYKARGFPVIHLSLSHLTRETRIAVAKQRYSVESDRALQYGTLGVRGLVLELAQGH